MRKHSRPAAPLDLGVFSIQAPKDNGVACAARVSPDTKDVIARLIAQQVGPWRKESDFVRSAIALLLREIAPALTGGRDSVSEDVRIINIQHARSRRLARRYEHQAFVDGALDVTRKSLAAGLVDETIDELVRSMSEAKDIHPQLAQRLAIRLEVEPKLAEAWAEAKKIIERREKLLSKVACDCGHKLPSHHEGKACTAKGCGCETFSPQRHEDEDDE